MSHNYKKPGCRRMVRLQKFQAGGMVETHPANKRPVLHNKDGSIATEESFTITHPRMNEGKPTNVPSIWGGKRPPFEDRETQEDWAVNQANKSGEKFQSFDTIDDAVSAAKERSKMLGRTYNK